MLASHLGYITGNGTMSSRSRAAPNWNSLLCKTMFIVCFSWEGMHHYLCMMGQRLLHQSSGCPRWPDSYALHTSIVAGPALLWPYSHSCASGMGWPEQRSSRSSSIWQMKKGRQRRWYRCFCHASGLKTAEHAIKGTGSNMFYSWPSNSKVKAWTSTD